MIESTKKNRINLKLEATSLAVLLVTVFFFSALVGIQFVKKASAIDYTEYTGTLNGADWALRIPDQWNGMLVVACRGSFGPELPDPLLTLNQHTFALDQDFAVAASNYGATRFCVKAGVNSTYELTRHVIDNYNVTGRVFLSGASLGGIVALLVGAKYSDLYSGVLDFFGIKDLEDRYNRLIRWAGLNDSELEAEMTALGITTIPPPTYSTLQEWRDKCANAANAIEQETGGTPATHPQEYEDLSPTCHTNITIPVITVHGTDDATVPYYQSLMYNSSVAAAGCSHLYRLYTVAGGGHNGGTSNERPERFIELVEWSNYLTGVYDWPMFRHDLQHTGYSDSPAPSTNQTLWNYTTGGDVYSSPAVVDGKVYIGSYDKSMYCLDAATGALIWNYTTGGGVNYPAVAGGRVYVGSDDDKVYCLDALTGAHVWNYTTGGDVHSSPVVDDDRVYVGSWDRKVYCLDALNGDLMWNYTTGGVVWGSPAVADGKVYVGSYDDKKVYCLDASNGDLMWNYTTGQAVGSSPTIANGAVFIGSGDKNVYCLDASTGTQIWNYTTGGIVGSSPAVADGKVYVGSYDGKFYCLDASSGAHIWNYTTGNQVVSSPAVADGKVYVGSYDGKFYCLDASTGSLIWSYTTGDRVGSSPAVAGGVVYVGSFDDRVYAFGTEYIVPEGFSVEIVLLLAAAATLVSLSLFRKRPKLKKH